MLLFCDTDSNGNITSYVAGERIIPDRQYQHYIFLQDGSALEHIEDFIVANGKLIQKG